MQDLLARLRARYDAGQITAEQCYHAWTVAVAALANELGE